MMKKFVGFTTNGEYSVGCTGQTVYLYDKSNNEIGKFKDIICWKEVLYYDCIVGFFFRRDQNLVNLIYQNYQIFLL